MKNLYGLLGKNISYSFSKGYFTEKFKNLNLDHCEYRNFDLDSIDDLPYILNEHMNELKGFNVTIPYKEAVFKYLDEIDADAEKIGAVNCVKVIEDYRLKGFNTDVYGFEHSLKPLIKAYHTKALILGSGGASKAVRFVFDKLHIAYKIVSRSPSSFQNAIRYADLDKELMSEHLLVVNTTPLGTFPDVTAKPAIPFEWLTEKHLLYDLIYNPPETAFLKWGKIQGAATKNGMEMLELQAEKAWAIWKM